MTKLKYIDGNCYCPSPTLKESTCLDCGGLRIEPIAEIIKKKRGKK